MVAASGWGLRAASALSEVRANVTTPNEHRRGTLARAGCALALGLTGASGCTKFASEEDAVPTTELAASEAAPTDFSCVAAEAGNPIMPGAGAPLDYSVLALDFISGRTPANMLVRGCYRGDLLCARPATEWIAPDLEDGRVTLPLTEGFSGYLEITSDDMVPTILVFPAALSPELATALGPITVAMLPPEMLLAFAGASQLQLDPAAGLVAINTFDCKGPFAPGVRLELNAPAVPFMFVDGLPLAFRDTTTDEGSGGFANVLPGLVVVRGFDASTMQEVGLETVPVRSQWVTVANLMPQFAGTP